MKALTYQVLIVLSRWFGLWIFTLVSRIIAAGYFFMFPRQAAVSAKFYSSLFPGKGRLFHWQCAWRQYQNFTTVFMDRLRTPGQDNIRSTSAGWQGFEDALDKGRGAIVLMSHMGNWDVAASLMAKKRKNLKLLLYMGAKAKEQIESVQKQELNDKGIRIVAVEPSGGSPLDVVEGIRFLKSGGVVSLTGDKLWHPDQRSVSVPFLGKTARIPEFPHVFALVSKAPLFVFFTFRTGPGTYRFMLSDPIRINCPSRAERNRAVAESARAYAGMLEKTLREHPYEWYHFEPFLVDHPGRHHHRNRI
ncbi:lauroyl acyltransferase [Desulfobacter hydrogenophilus]|uniref:Lauroyl acyltransferase n=1 Tax=Desulfobacter hydrogenophilus TaxID=2291 RepID=A0A328FCV1_9BACT|nr:lysophospholipid acyltransferase family protein [Desulfobacter hydrogenophilus]NDY72629.1 lysophospholipid acyltransferase family protein [Desulfobacter hydrogenophilus]QBH13348.1 lauroyl acyltransferase [Desulfobacter hydrogenophilus]RAM01252.1 lauroyl acyltransferase [Desulfobacter hydrogenophilus]